MGEETELKIGKDLLTLAQASRYLAESSLERQDWSGLPVPIPGLNLVLEPRYKHKALSEFSWKECYDEHGVRQVIDEPPPAAKSEFKTVNSWWNDRYQVTVLVVKDKEGRAQARVRFEDTWAGVMCPTDEVIAHLLMMRGSEEKFWANANQHPLDRPAAGV